MEITRPVFTATATAATVSLLRLPPQPRGPVANAGAS